MYYLIHNISVKLVSLDFYSWEKLPLKKVKRLPKVTRKVQRTTRTPTQTI